MRRKRPCGNWCMLLGIQQVAQLTLQWLNAFWMHNGLPASAITEVVLMQSYSSSSAIERYSENPAWDQWLYSVLKLSDSNKLGTKSVCMNSSCCKCFSSPLRIRTFPILQHLYNRSIWINSLELIRNGNLSYGHLSCRWSKRWCVNQAQPGTCSPMLSVIGFQRIHWRY